MVWLVACGSVAPIPTETPAPTASPTPEASRERHYEPEGGFSYVPPAGWDLVDSPSMPYATAIGPGTDDFSANLTIMDEPFAGTLGEYVTLSLNNMREFFEGLEVVRQEQFRSVEGPPGVKIVTKNVQRGRALHQVFYLFNADATKFVITCTRLAVADEAVDVVCEESVRTFRLESE